jgi:caa(3)-type oxidase subunit IV
MAEASPELREQHFQDFDTKAEASRLGMWIFLATEILLFGGLFVSYFYYRWLFLDAWLACTGHLDRLMGSIETLVLITSSLFAALSLGFFRRQAHKAAALCLFATAACGLAFLVLHGFEYLHEIREGALPGKYYGLAHLLRALLHHDRAARPARHGGNVRGQHHRRSRLAAQRLRRAAHRAGHALLAPGGRGLDLPLSAPLSGLRRSVADNALAAHKDSLPGYLVVWVLLIGLTLGTWAFSYVHLGAWSMVIALGFAAAKAGLVGWFFMHLSQERATSRLAIGLAFLFIGLLTIFTLSDVVTRLPPSRPGANGELRLGESPRAPR